MVFKTTIPRNIRLSEAPSHGQPIILYDFKSKGAFAYIELARELIGRNGGDKFLEGANMSEKNSGLTNKGTE